MNYEWLTLVPLAQTAITVSLSGYALLLILIATGAYAGYQSGIRGILTIAIWSIVAYITTVQGGDFLVGLINRFWQNGPRLVAFAIGNSPDSAARLDPLIEPGFQVPLFFRVVAFIALVLLGFFFNRKATWKGPPKEPLAKPLGLFVGGLIAMIWTNAIVVFWDEYQSGGGSLGGPISPLATALNTLPNVSLLIPSLILVFFLILVIIVIFYFPKVWKP